MTLVTTPGDPNADSYFSLADALAYFTPRGVAAWTGSDTVLENAARRGTTYLDNQYRDRWIGLRANETQSLSWPRVDGWRNRLRGYTEPLLDLDGFQIMFNIVPVQVQHAAMEAALLVVTGVTLEPMLVRGGAIKSIGKSVGPLRKDIVYADNAPVIDRYTVIEGLLRGLARSTPGASSGVVNLVRS